MPKFTDEQKPAITKIIAPAVLFYFRWAALATIVTGLIVAYLNGYVHDATYSALEVVVKILLLVSVCG